MKITDKKSNKMPQKIKQDLNLEFSLITKVKMEYQFFQIN